MNLKFKDISYNEKRLMYVEFSDHGKLLRWYPKWKDVAEVLFSAFATESGLNRRKLTPYLSFICLEALLRDNLPLVDLALIRKFDEVLDQMREALFTGFTENP